VLKHKGSCLSSDRAGDSLDTNEIGCALGCVGHKVLNAARALDRSRVGLRDLGIGELGTTANFLVSLFVPAGGTVECMAEVKEVLDEALKLGPDERASVAVELLESLEAAPEERAEVETAWAAEIERRARRVLRGKSDGTAWDEVRRRTEANLTKR
jgi:putative addiction module component (TIGR02574 family)